LYVVQCSRTSAAAVVEANGKERDPSADTSSKSSQDMSSKPGMILHSAYKTVSQTFFAITLKIVHKFPSDLAGSCSN